MYLEISSSSNFVFHFNILFISSSFWSRLARMFSLFFLRIENVRHLMFKNCYVLPHSVFLAFICVGLPKRQRCLVSPLQSGIMGGGVRGIIAAIAHMYTMLTPCTVLMHACAWIMAWGRQTHPPGAKTPTLARGYLNRCISLYYILYMLCLSGFISYSYTYQTIPNNTKQPLKNTKCTFNYF